MNLYDLALVADFERRVRLVMAGRSPAPGLRLAEPAGILPAVAALAAATRRFAAWLERWAGGPCDERLLTA